MEDRMSLGLLEREAKVEALREFLDRVGAGSGALLVVEGPAGIGKTALLDACAMAAGERDLRVLRARGDEVAMEPSFAGVRELLWPEVTSGGLEGLEGAARLAARVFAGDRSSSRWSNKLRGTSHAIGTAIDQASNQTDHQVLTTFRALATRWQSQLSQLETLNPPSNLAASFNTLTGAANRVESDLNAIVSAAGTHSGSAARQAGASLVDDIMSAKSASTSITDRLGVQ